ncbi:hypothetical protein HZH66_013389 [Vespula vulgaris]|uniref:Uncharacterized protein n=1 Tax=Vespula vulgaris TaxID=7454 RepID=A0A834J7Q9_VESVU|nr:hypothetical protein HZH66_013389 [Vespula vulgaris]
MSGRLSKSPEGTEISKSIPGKRLSKSAEGTEISKSIPGGRLPSSRKAQKFLSPFPAKRKKGQSSFEQSCFPKEASPLKYRLTECTLLSRRKVEKKKKKKKRSISKASNVLACGNYIPLTKGVEEEWGWKGLKPLPTHGRSNNGVQSNSAKEWKTQEYCKS